MKRKESTRVRLAEKHVMLAIQYLRASGTPESGYYANRLAEILTCDHGESGIVRLAEILEEKEAKK